MSIRYNLPLLALALAGVSLSAASVALDTSGPHRLFAAMIMTKEQQASSVPTDSGVLLHHSKSGEWHRLGPAIQMVSSASSDPSNRDILYLACGNGIARSADGGESWKLVTGWRESDVIQIAVDPENGDNLYAATIWGVTISHDGGESWKAANKGLPEYFSKGIVIDGSDPNRLLLATTTGLFESTNQAQCWQRVESFPEVAVLRLRRSLENPDFWIAGTEGQGVWISTDDAKTWRQTAQALKNANVYAVAIDPVNPERMAAGGWATGVYFSNDGGRAWQLTEEPLPSPNITSMTFDLNAHSRLWVSTFEEGTFHTDDLGSTWTSANLDGAYVFDLGFL